MRKPVTPEDTLKQRDSIYGDFTTNAEIAQQLKDVLRGHDGRLSAPHKEALDLIMTKIGRILNGDPNHDDNWHDIAGFALLAKERCNPI